MPRLAMNTRVPETPVLRIDLDRIRRTYHELTSAFSEFDIFYAVKANPHPEVLSLLATLGASFDVASPAEITAALSAGATPDRLSYGNTVKKYRDIVFAREYGVDLFACDSQEEVYKIAQAAPGSRVFCRLLVDSEGAQWPLSRKFGCAQVMAAELMVLARDLGLVPYGLSFHVGSQQVRTDQWDKALDTAAGVARSLSTRGIAIAMINIGGGLPAKYVTPVPASHLYAEEIRASMLRHFGRTDGLHLVAEVGRGLVAQGGVIETEVVLVSKKHPTDESRWVYLDVGVFHGLAETLGESIKYPIIAPDRRPPNGPVILAGPTCDSADIMYQDTVYQLPLALRPGDRLRILSAGAYTYTYSSVAFNGIPPLRVICEDTAIGPSLPTAKDGRRRRHPRTTAAAARQTKVTQ